MKGRDFLLGMAVGSLVGTALGLLFAPQSGEETRDSLREYADELSEKVKEGSRHLAESSRDFVQKGQSQMMEMLHHGEKDEA